MSTYDRARYLRYKEKQIPTQIACNKKWVARQPEEYKDYMRAIVRKSAAKHYQNNKEQILAYKKRYSAMKKEIMSMMNLYNIYE
jgi:hypothetical protein